MAPGMRRRPGSRPRNSATCGLEAQCGRTAGHSGQHGGWRTNLRAVAPGPVSFDHVPVLPGATLSPTEVSVLAEYVEHGNMELASECLGRSLQTVKNHLQRIHAKAGVNSTLEALHRLGWITLPPGAPAHRSVA